MQRFAFVVDVVPEKRDEYVRLHADVWPGVEALLSAHHVTNYSIFLIEDTLFGYYEYVGDDHDADQRRIAADPVSQEWWKLTDPCNVAIGGERDSRSPWQPLDEIWHMQ